MMTAISCGECWFCQHAMPTHCEKTNPKYGPEGGLLDQKDTAIFGYSDLYGGYDGGQAEMVRVPCADFGARKVPEGEPDEKYLSLRCSAYGYKIFNDKEDIFRRFTRKDQVI
jgi:S-(hydroxymethyl)glutathione dehydrogenase/alcohol dehydrogenase